MEVFVLANKSGRLAKVKEELEAKQKKLGAVHNLVSGKVASRFMKMMDKISEREGDGQWADLDDDLADKETQGHYFSGV